jgi:gluconolactonase
VSTESLRVDARSCALIRSFRNLQNDVITDGGAFADSGAPSHAKSQSIVANVQRLADAARSAGMPVIHVHYIAEAGARGLKQNAPFVGVTASNALVRGTWGAAHSGIKPLRQGARVARLSEIS